VTVRVSYVVFWLCLYVLDKIGVDSQLVRRCRSEKWSMYSFDFGLQTLPDELVRHLKRNNDINIRAETPCTQLQITPNKVEVVAS